MPLQRRSLKVTLHFVSGDIVLDETVDLRVKIHKDALAVQNSCSIEVVNLTQSLRAQLLSQFTAFNKKRIEMRKAEYGTADNPYVNVTVRAGYHKDGQDSTSVVFDGQVVLVTPSNYPPNLTTRIECASRQVDKLKYIRSNPPTNSTFKEYVDWVATQLQVSYICETSINNSKNWNQSSSTMVAGALLIDLQNAYRPDVVAYIDNNVLIVRDLNKVISSANKVTVDEFIGTPMWNTWGAEFVTLFDPKITLTSAATLRSEMNDSLNKQDFVIISVDYDLTSRDIGFYVKATGCPAA